MNLRTIQMLAATVLCAALALPARAGNPEDTARDAVTVLRSLADIPEKGIPPRLFNDAAGIAVIPGLIKAGFVVGGRHGNGVLSVRDDSGAWSLPSFISVTGGSIGFQAGVQSIDLVLVFKTHRSIAGIMHGKFTLGGDASAAAGPVGRTASAATDAQLKAEIYAYSRSRGLFAGIALDGTVIEIDPKANADAYGSGAVPESIFAGEVSQRPAPVVQFTDALEERTAEAAARNGD